MHRVAIEISKSSVWLVSGSSSGGKVQIDHLLHQSIAAPDEAPAALSSMVKAAGLRGNKCVAVVRRADAEVRTAMLPSTELNELPDMVRFSATRLFANAGETWPIDFLVLAKAKVGGDEGTVEQTNALVTALPPSFLNQLRNCCTVAGLELQSVFLAPIVAANAALRCSTIDVDDSSSFLIADGYEAGSELTICKEGKVQFLRNVRTPLKLSDNDINIFSGEIKRTSMAAAGAELPVQFDSVVALGVEPEHATALSGLIQRPVTAVPLDALLKLDRLKGDEQENISKSGWITVAMALAEPVTAKVDRAIESREIDFLNPRRAIVAKRSVPMMIASGAGAAAIVLGGVLWYFVSHSSLDQEIAMLNQQLANDEKNIDIAKAITGQQNDVDAFLSSNFNWLDELAYISTKSLPADQAVIPFFDASVVTKVDLENQVATQVTVGHIDLKAAVVAAGTGPVLDRALRDKNHSIQNNSWMQWQSQEGYNYKGNPIVTVVASNKTQWELPSRASASAPASEAKPSEKAEPTAPASAPESTEKKAEPAAEQAPKPKQPEPEKVEAPKTEPATQEQPS